MDKLKLLTIDPAASASSLDLNAIAQSIDNVFTDPNSGFNTVNRQACFVAQICIESWHFHTLSENLNYSVQALLTEFPSHFDAPTAIEYAHQPEKIANRAYANRMGNGDENSGDGWKYRGRGLIQLTGKFEYQQFATYANIDCVNNPDLLLTPDAAVKSTVWFYTKQHNLNAFADSLNVASITKIINGGLSDLQARTDMTNRALSVLGS